MANVTYYIGAGASAGKRSKTNGQIIEGLPDKLVVKELNDFRAEKPQVKEMLITCGLPEQLAKSYFRGYDYRRATLSFK